MKRAQSVLVCLSFSWEQVFVPLPVPVVIDEIYRPTFRSPIFPLFFFVVVFLLTRMPYHFNGVKAVLTRSSFFFFSVSVEIYLRPPYPIP